MRGEALLGSGDRSASLSAARTLSNTWSHRDLRSPIDHGSRGSGILRGGHRCRSRHPRPHRFDPDKDYQINVRDDARLKGDVTFGYRAKTPSEGWYASIIDENGIVTYSPVTVQRLTGLKVARNARMTAGGSP
ncbi:hypothetical protein [Actinoallomurus iriomotensis]|uniref:hypothetical protein n=1 Tax=Actinoallomurus iriomotensis TaxID=478107 RepID=UPI002554D2D6|nr:hypothetical protein [Actinoallomurus iriomotensis]